MTRLSKGSKLGRDTMNTEQLIEKYSERLPIYKSGAMKCVTNKLIRTKKPVCTKLGIVNPVKLNISSDTLNKISKKEVQNANIKIKNI